MPDRLSLPWLSRDAWLLFLTRALRLFAYGAPPIAGQATVLEDIGDI